MWEETRKEEERGRMDGGCHTAIVQLFGRGFVGIENFGQFWEDD